MSDERKRRGRTMLEKKLGALVLHRADTVRDIDAAGRESSDPEPEVPDAVELEALGDYFQNYYRRWLDEQIPALGDKTPRQAVRTKRGRTQVTALLKDIENGTLTQRGGDRVDFDALRRELGLD